MKKYLLVLLFCLFGLLHTQTAFGTVAPLYPTRYQEACSMITNIHRVDGYKLVSVSGFDGYINEVKPFTCTKGFIFLVPEDLDISTLKTIEWPAENRKNYPGYFKSSWDLQDSLNGYFGTNYMWALDNEDTRLVGKLLDQYSYYSYKEKPSHLLVLNSLELQKNGDFRLIDYCSISYGYYYIFYAIGGILLICGIVWYIKKRRKNKAE